MRALCAALSSLRRRARCSSLRSWSEDRWTRSFESRCRQFASSQLARYRAAEAGHARAHFAHAGRAVPFCSLAHHDGQHCDCQPAAKRRRLSANGTRAIAQDGASSTHRCPQVAVLILLKIFPGVIVLILPLESSQATSLLARPAQVESGRASGQAATAAVAAAAAAAAAGCLLDAWARTAYQSAPEILAVVLLQINAAPL